ncbi:FkbM family methyltransferase [Sphingorhabdus sp. EL138]|uniref:FkbM family methyltransferase n=1 Tax=Sphingorhabdus sp. EL138 TaxID=2073156 RepID=UPI0025CD427C|nr:FkbM family methyltransferase [Sphingorhabdus sp. EL138]
MKLIGELYFPDSEQHFMQYGEAIGAYQKPQRDKALEYVTNWETCIDVGANVGIFSRHFATRFIKVVAIEPVAENVACLELNVPSNVEIMKIAVGEEARSIHIQRTPKNVGGAFVCDHALVDCPIPADNPDMIEEVQMVTIDSLDLKAVGLVKLDIQGSELIALRGSSETLLRCRPVVLIEEKPIGGKGGSIDHIAMASEFLIGLGMHPREKVGADRIYAF